MNQYYTKWGAQTYFHIILWIFCIYNLYLRPGINQFPLSALIIFTLNGCSRHSSPFYLSKNSSSSMLITGGGGVVVRLDGNLSKYFENLPNDFNLFCCFGEGRKSKVG